MKIIFMGSAAFAVPSLEALLNSKHDVIEVITQPDKPAGRGRHITACPVGEFAKGKQLLLFQPKGIKNAEALEHIRNLAPELIAVVAYGKMLPNALLDLPPRGCVNVHSSLLPKYRGAAPMNWAIVNGERETGVTTMRISEEMDAGNILLSCKTPIDDAEDAVKLHDRLAPMGATLLLETIDRIENGTITETPQDHSKATFAPIIKKTDGLIDWNLSASAIYNRVRGFKPWPGTFTKLKGRTFRIHEAATTESERKAQPGTIIESDDRLAVACGEGTLYLLEVQLEGKRKMSAGDFLRGHKIETGTVLE